QSVTLDALMMLGANPAAAPEARTYVLEALRTLATSLGKRRSGDRLAAAWDSRTAADIAIYLESPEDHAPKKLAPEWGEGPRSRFPMPPGLPLG
ncbi:MAG: hypothetical protein NTX28_05635, partial [Novosphingobium sp.]|nr:hypothetical protein [Novosphingobium sp.]